MVITPDFGSSNVGSIPAGTTLKGLVVQWIEHKTSNLRIPVQLWTGSH